MIVTNVFIEGMKHVTTLKDLQRIEDIDMVKIVLAFKKSKNTRKIKNDESDRRGLLMAEEAERRRSEERKKVLLANIKAARQHLDLGGPSRLKPTVKGAKSPQRQLRILERNKRQQKFDDAYKALDAAKAVAERATGAVETEAAEALVATAIAKCQEAEQELKEIIALDARDDIADSTEDVVDDLVVSTFGVSTNMTFTEYVDSLRIQNRYKDEEFDCACDSKRVIEVNPNIQRQIRFNCLPEDPSPDDVKQGGLGDLLNLL